MGNVQSDLVYPDYFVLSNNFSLLRYPDYQSQKNHNPVFRTTKKSRWCISTQPSVNFFLLQTFSYFLSVVSYFRPVSFTS